MRDQLHGRSLPSLLHSKRFLVGAFVLISWVAIAASGPAVLPHDPLAQDLLSANAPPSSSHYFGTDALGRDVLSRVLAGAQEILIVAPSASVLGVVLGASLGLFQAYFGGSLDLVLGKIIDALLALPAIVLVFLLVATLGPSPLTIVSTVGLTFALPVSRTIRTTAIQEMQQGYVAAARLRGEGIAYILTVEVLPNVGPAIIVESTVRLGYAIFSVATLSFLGFGIRPPTPDWGGDIASNYGYLSSGFWWETVFPAAAIVSLVVSVTAVADAIDSALLSDI